VKIRLLGTAVILAPLLLAVGCGASSNQASSVCDTPGVSPGKIDLGLVYPASGRSAGPLQTARAGIDARLGLVNAAGGINGRKISYEWRDDASLLDGNNTAVHSLVPGADIFGVIEESSVASGGAAYLAQQNVPVLGLSSEPVWLQYPNMVPDGTTAILTDVWGKVFQRAGATNVAVLGQSLSTSDTDAVGQIAASIRSVGLTATEVRVNATDDPQTVAQRVAAVGADAITGLLDPSALGSVVRDLGSTHQPRAVLAFSGYDQQLLHTAGPAMAGIYVPVFFRPFEASSPAMSRYFDAMAKYSPQVPDPRQEYALRSYVDTDLFIRGLQAAGPCPTRASFLNALHAIPSYDADGLIPAVDLRTSNRTQTCLALMRVRPDGTAFDVADLNICGEKLAS
jgi:branched-chain amino acid transport system substrate-binding protein